MGKWFSDRGSAKILELCFEVLGFEEVYAFCALENPASARVLTKLGMTEVGRIPNDKQFNGQWVSSQHFKMIKVNYLK